jgi:hypothetical protein
VDAIATVVNGGGAAPHDPLAELSFRDFAEVLVRISALRYPALPGLARRLQVVLQQHVSPLLGAARRGGAGGGAGPRGLQGGGAAGGAGAGAGGSEQQLASEEVVAYLRGRAEQLQVAFAAVASALPSGGGSSTGGGTAGAGHALVSGWGGESGSPWHHHCTTARRVLRRLVSEGLLETHRLTAGGVAAALLESLLGAKDAAQAPRLVRA